MAKKVNKMVKEEINIKEGIILIVVLLVLVVLMYFLTIGAQKLGWFNEGYIKPEVTSPVISYNNILVGSMFNRSETEYYVLVADINSDESIYLSSLVNLYNKKEGDKLHLYVVDLEDGLNKSVIDNTSNPSAQNVSSLKVNGPTLFRIRNGANVRCLEGVENIKTELGV